MKNYQAYRLKERFWTIRDRYDIEDEDGNSAYEINGKLFAWGNKLTIKNAAGEECLKIDQKQLSFRPKYSILRDGEKVAEVVKKIGVFKQKLELELENGTEYQIKGNFLNREYEFLKKGKVVTEVSKKWWRIKDTYGVRIAEEEDAEIILATIVIIDLMLHEEEEEDEDS